MFNIFFKNIQKPNYFDVRDRVKILQKKPKDLTLIEGKKYISCSLNKKEDFAKKLLISQAPNTDDGSLFNSIIEMAPTSVLAQNTQKTAPISKGQLALKSTYHEKIKAQQNFRKPLNTISSKIELKITNEKYISQEINLLDTSPQPGVPSLPKSYNLSDDFNGKLIETNQQIEEKKLVMDFLQDILTDPQIKLELYQNAIIKAMQDDLSNQLLLITASSPNKELKPFFMKVVEFTKNENPITSIDLDDTFKEFKKILNGTGVKPSEISENLKKQIAKIFFILQYTKTLLENEDLTNIYEQQVFANKINDSNFSIESKIESFKSQTLQVLTKLSHCKVTEILKEKIEDVTTLTKLLSPTSNEPLKVIYNYVDQFCETLNNVTKLDKTSNITNEICLILSNAVELSNSINIFYNQADLPGEF